MPFESLPQRAPLHPQNPHLQRQGRRKGGWVCMQQLPRGMLAFGRAVEAEQAGQAEGSASSRGRCMPLIQQHLAAAASSPLGQSRPHGTHCRRGPACGTCSSKNRRTGWAQEEGPVHMIPLRRGCSAVSLAAAAVHQSNRMAQPTASLLALLPPLLGLLHPSTAAHLSDPGSLSRSNTATLPPGLSTPRSMRSVPVHWVRG